jgi:hypothetical protein
VVRDSIVRALALTLAGSLLIPSLRGEQIPVRHKQGSAHGFLEIRDSGGVHIASGDYIQTVHGNLVICRVVFHFHDDSIDDDTTIFTQQNAFRLVSDHHIQRGPSFPQPIDVFIDAKTGRVTSRSIAGKIEVEQLELPVDVANGLPPNLLLNISPTTPETRVSFVAPTTKPRLVHISIRPAGEIHFTVGGTPRKATDYVLHVELGGITGVIAPLIGKQPRDFHIYIMEGKVPTFIREEGQLYEGGPVWHIEQISPVFPH